MSARAVKEGFGPAMNTPHLFHCARSLLLCVLVFYILNTPRTAPHHTEHPQKASTIYKVVSTSSCLVCACRRGGPYIHDTRPPGREGERAARVGACESLYCNTRPRVRREAGERFGMRDTRVGWVLGS